MVNEKEFIAMRYRHNNVGATSVDWYIGKRCNFDCSYCVDYLHDNTSPHVPLENMKKFVDYVYERNKQNVYWSLTGGEPTLNPDFVELCKYIKSRGARNISITTNGSRTFKYFTELYEYLDNITLSLHFEFMGKKIEEYIEKIIKLENWRKEWNEAQKSNPDFPNHLMGYQKKTMLIRFMVYPGMLETIEYMNKKFVEAGVEKIEYRYIRPLSGSSNEQMPSKKLTYDKNHDVEKKPSLLHKVGHELKTRVTRTYLARKYKDLLEDPSKTPQTTLSSKDKVAIKAVMQREDKWYNNNEKEKINNLFSKETKKRLLLYFDTGQSIEKEEYHYNKLNFEKKSNFEGWICWAGIKHMKITPTGDIYVGSCHVGGKRGNIYEIDKGIDLPTEPFKCPKWRCTDNLDLRVPKIKDMKYFKLVEASVNGITEEKKIETSNVR
ncbi:MAG: radical SAM protein [Bdellovibrionales bacterium]|nr:radical SAM protein [Bdellovibrionales bacterium]NQZ18248.1 radical SAM protein [Bdellovibrionales bacterium]